MPSWKKVILSGSDAALNSLEVTTNVTATSFTGSLLGTASFADQALSSSYSLTATSASHALNTDNAISSSHALNADNAISSSYSLTATSASHALDADNAISASHALASDTSISASHALNADNAISASHALNADNAISASHALASDTSISASHALNADNSISASYAATASSADSFNIRVALTSSGLIYPTTDGTLNQSIVTDGAGNLTFGDPFSSNTVVNGKNISGGTIEKGTPLYFTASGVSGNIVGVLPADAGNSSLMPAGGIAGEQMLDEAEGVILLNGFINGVDTSAFASGDEIYVAVGGGYTNVVPTGSALVQKLGNVEKSDASNGSGVINGPAAARSVPNINPGYTWVGDGDWVATPVSTASLFVTSASYAITSTSASHALNTDSAISSSYSLTATSASHALNADNAISASYALSSSYARQVDYSASAFTEITVTSTQPRGVTLTRPDGTTSNALISVDSASYANTATSSSQAISADTASFLPSTTNLNITSISASIAVFQSASIGYLTTVTGSATIIGDSFILLNTGDAQRYAGLLVEDSGSAPTNYTSSFFYDSQLNDWNYEYTTPGGTDFGVALFGPEYNTKGSPTYLTADRVPKAEGTHHLVDSNITDDGTTVSISSPLKIQGYLQNTNSGFLSYTFNSGSTIGTLASNQVLFTIGSGTYESVTVEYVVFDSTRSNKRAGTLRGTWDDDTTAIVFNETTTTDIGDTAGFTLDMVNDGAGTISVRATNNLGGSMTIIYEYKLLGAL